MKKLIFYIVIILFIQCRQRIEIPLTANETSLLIVEGIINYGGETAINLSRSAGLAEKRIIPEINAIISVQGEDNSVFPLTETDSGKYVAQIPVNPSIKYRIKFTTTSNKEYASDYRSVIRTPLIDSVSWKRNAGISDGVQIYVTTHDPENLVQYYKWDYEEVWEFRSKYESKGSYDTTFYPYGEFSVLVKEHKPPLGRDFDSSKLICWKYQNSSNILISSTIKLSSSVIFERPLVFFYEDSWPLSRLYSIRVKQYGISREAYDFYALMEKNTESMGSPFDGMPSEISGNVHCLSNPDEPVIGFIEAASMTDKRIFISNAELPGWFYDMFCDEGGGYANTIPDVKIAQSKDLDPTSVAMDEIPPNSGNFVLLGFQAEPKLCVDCRLRGTNRKPDYWPW